MARCRPIKLGTLFACVFRRCTEHFHSGTLERKCLRMTLRVNKRNVTCNGNPLPPNIAIWKQHTLYWMGSFKIYYYNLKKHPFFQIDMTAPMH